MKHACSKTLIIAGALLLAAAAVAQDKGMAMQHPAKGMTMEQHQKAAIPAAEYDDYAKDRFEKMDINHDGFVTAAEMDQSHMAIGKEDTKMMHERSSADVIREMDSNRDGKLSEAEYRAGMKKMFDKLDTDQNGTLSPTEQEMAHQTMMMGHS
ncbi:MAG: EF-hand domain-containing protein [Stenotrophomonas sp.]